jgi:hypothetical protein
VLDRTKNFLSLVCANCVIDFTSRWTGRWGRVELSLKHGLMVWVIDDWPVELAVNDSMVGDSSLAQPIPAEE